MCETKRENTRIIKNSDLLYPDLSYEVVGAIYEVWKRLGSAFKESKQIWYYLKGTSYKLLLLVNFGGRKLEIKRRIYDKARKGQKTFA